MRILNGECASCVHVVWPVPVCALLAVTTGACITEASMT